MTWSDGTGPKDWYHLPQKCSEESVSARGGIPRAVGVCGGSCVREIDPQLGRRCVRSVAVCVARRRALALLAMAPARTRQRRHHGDCGAATRSDGGTSLGIKTGRGWSLPRGQEGQRLGRMSSCGGGATTRGLGSLSGRREPPLRLEAARGALRQHETLGPGVGLPWRTTTA